MQEIRLHGRGGQGLVKASHLVVKTAVETGHYGQFISGNVTYVAAFYILDIAMVTTDLVLTMRNKRLDRAAEQEETV